MGQADDALLSGKDGRRRKRSSSKARQGTQSWRYLNLALTREDKAALREAEWDTLDFDQFLSEACIEGYKFSLTFSVDPDVWTATVSGNQERCVNYQWILTAKASNKDDACAALMLKVEKLGLRNLWSLPDEVDDFIE